MIGDFPVGHLPGILITAVAHEGLRVSIDGRPVRFAIIDDDGTVLAAGDAVAREAEAVAVNSFRQFLMGKGYLRVMSKPIPPGGAA